MQQTSIKYQKKMTSQLKKRNKIYLNTKNLNYKRNSQKKFAKKIKKLIKVKSNHLSLKQFKN